MELESEQAVYVPCHALKPICYITPQWRYVSTRKHKTYSTKSEIIIASYILGFSCSKCRKECFCSVGRDG